MPSGDAMTPRFCSIVCLFLVLMADYCTNGAPSPFGDSEIPHVFAVVQDVYPISRDYRAQIFQKIVTPASFVSHLVCLDSLDAEEPAYALVEVHAPAPAGQDLLTALMSYQC
jgi:hypothetical protein